MVIFAWVFAEQGGLPIPSFPILLVAGALSGSGQMNLGAAIGHSFMGAVLADWMWYELGRQRGVRVLQFLCKVSL